MVLCVGHAFKGRNQVYISNQALNPSVLVTGLSGAGKSWKLFQLEESIMKSGNQLLILDFHGSHHNRRFWEKVGKRCEVNQIDIHERGIPLSILSPLKMPDGKAESTEDAANSVLKILANVTPNLGDRQAATLRQAILEAVKNRHLYANNEMRGIDEALENIDDPRAEALREKLWFLLNKCLISTNAAILESGKVNIFDLNGFDFETQVQVAELILNLAWRYLTRYGSQNAGILYLVCDEAQNFSANSVLSNILREGRKHHVGVIIATQTLQTFSKGQRAVIEQAATKLHFRPAGTEALQLATAISAKDRMFWRDQLLRLRTGQCVAVGSFMTAGGVEVQRPLVLSEQN